MAGQIPRHQARDLGLLRTTADTQGIELMQISRSLKYKSTLAGIAAALLAVLVSAQADDALTTQSVAMNAGGTSSEWQLPEMPKPTAYADVNLSPEQIAELREDWGIEVLGIRLASADYMMDFRFRVLDVDKALTLFDHRIKPHLIVDRTQIKLPVPMAAKVGAFRPTNRGKNIKPDKNYYMIFGNPDRHVKAGETVTIVVGDFRIDHLLVN